MAAAYGEEVDDDLSRKLAAAFTERDAIKAREEAERAAVVAAEARRAAVAEALHTPPPEPVAEPNADPRLLAQMQVEYEEECARLRERAAEAASRGDSVPEYAASPSALPGRGVWNAWEGASEGAATLGAALAIPPSAAGFSLPSLEFSPYKRCFRNAPPEVPVPPVAMPPGWMEGAVVPSAPPPQAPLVAFMPDCSELTLGERRIFASDAAAFAARLALDAELPSAGLEAVLYVASGLARYAPFAGAQHTALTWLTNQMRPSAPFTAYAPAWVEDSLALPHAFALLARPESPAFPAACTLCVALIERLGEHAALKVQAAGGIAACISALKHTAASVAMPGAVRDASAAEAGLRLLWALCATPGDASPDAIADAAASTRFQPTPTQSEYDVLFVTAEQRCASSVAGGVVPAAVKLLEVMPDLPPAAAVPLLGVLCSLALSRARAVAFKAPGGLEAFVATMRASADAAPPQLRGAAAAAARLLAETPDAGIRLSAAGGTEAMAKLMTKCQSHAQLQRDGCTVLRLLVFAWPEPSKALNAMGPSGAIAAIVGAMQAHLGDESVLASACKTLAAVSVCEANNVAAAEVGGIEACVAAQRMHPSLAVTEPASAALYAFTFRGGGVMEALGKASTEAGGLLAVGAAAIGTTPPRVQCGATVSLLQTSTADT